MGNTQYIQLYISVYKDLQKLSNFIRDDPQWAKLPKDLVIEKDIKK